MQGVAPLVEAGQLGGLLAQFPYSFKASKESLDHLRRLAAAFVHRSVPINVEFRHTSWYTENVYTELRALGLGFVNVDLPQLTNLPEPSNVLTSDVAYYRLHGRNARMWWNHPTPSHRYDYLYDDQELEEWAERVEQVRQNARVCYIFNNNCHLGQSVVNALQLRRRFGVKKPTLPPGVPAEMFAPPEQELAERIRDAIARARSRGETK